MPRALPLTLLTLAASVAGWYCAGLGQTSGHTGALNSLNRAASSARSGTLAGEAAPLDRFLELNSRVDTDYRVSLSVSERDLALFAAMRELRNEDFAAAIGALLPGADHETQDTIDALAAMWAERDPVACRDWVMRLANVGDRQMFIENVGPVLARLDPAGFLSWFSGLSNYERQALGSRMIGALATAAKADPVQGLKLVLEQGTFAKNLSAVGDVFTALAERDPSTAAARAAELQGGPALTGAVESVLRVWAARDATAARAWISGLDDAVLASHATAAFAEGLADRDPQSAAELVGALPDTLNYQNTLRHIVTTWGAKDSTAALAWIETLPETSDRGNLFAAMIEQRVQKDPQDALETMLAHPALLQQGASFSVAQAIGLLAATEDPSPWLQRLSKLPDDTQTFAVDSAMRTWAGRDLAAASTWAARQPAGSDTQTQAYGVLGRVSAEKDPDQFKTWVSAQPAGAARDAAIFSGTSQLARGVEGAERVAVFEYATRSLDREKSHQWLQVQTISYDRDPELDRWLEATPLLTSTDKASLRERQANR